jgi:PII-like signaling protein
MLPEQPAKLLRIHLKESDRYQGKPLYEAIVDKCREMKIAGATVFRGLEGYGETAEMHKSHLIRHDQPILITIVDTAESLARLVPAVEEMMDTGLIAISEVRMVRVQKAATPNERSG